MSMVYIDGEKIPDERIKDIFRWPPELPRSFERSALIIGSRGVGKTTLFRYLKATHSGPAIHLALAAEFASLGKDAVFGPLGTGYPKEVETFIVGKATSLLALSVAERLCAKGVQPDNGLLMACLPRRIATTPRKITGDWCKQTKDEANSLKLEAFADLSHMRLLPDFVSDLAQKANGSVGPLLLLLDRADMVVPAALIPVAELLDQSTQYVALVAMRPGHAAREFAAEELGAIPGDHYTVVHMGRSPYEKQWEVFLTEALEAQLGAPALAVIPEEIRRHILTLSRDSLRTALELAMVCKSATPSHLAAELSTALASVRENHLVAAQRVLQGYHPDFRKLVADIRREVVRRQGAITGRVHLAIEDSGANSLWEKNTRVDTFVEAALRSRAACMPSGRVWVPGLPVREVELPPVILWNESDPYWTYDSEAPTTARRSESSLFKVGGGAPPSISVFIAYRMDFSASRGFREDLETSLMQHPGPPRFRVVDGKVREGEDWAPVIRDRIKKSKLLVGDVTGLRNDVVFELGFGFGLKKPIIPVLESQREKEHIPHWLRAKQIGSFETPVELLSTTSSIIAHVSDPFISKPRKVRDPVPGLAIWLRHLNWATISYDQFAATCHREGLSHELLDNDIASDSSIEQATRASLLVICLDGTEADGLLHFICGAIVAHPVAGYSTRPLARRILILTPPEVTVTKIVADSLLRCTDIAFPVSPTAVAAAVSDYGRIYRHWFQAHSRSTVPDDRSAA